MQDKNGFEIDFDMTGWEPIRTAPEGKIVDTVIAEPDCIRNHQPLFRKGGMWFLPDNSMYVYYAPTHWRPLEREEWLDRWCRKTADEIDTITPRAMRMESRATLQRIAGDLRTLGKIVTKQ